MKHVYLAGPFFNPLQIAAQELVETLLDNRKIIYHSPRKSMVVPKDASQELCARIFKENIDMIEGAGLVLANIEGFDPGTMIEMGYAYRAGVPVIAYSLTSGRRLNIMVSQLVAGFCNGETELADFFNRWSVAVPSAKPWCGEAE